MVCMSYNGETGEFIGWYLKDIHANIPEPYIEISDSEHKAYYQLMSEGGYKLFIKNGKVVTELRQVTISWEDIRYMRDIKLKATDWSQARDIPDSLASKYTAYRQALRDIPQNFTDPKSVIWPSLSDFGIE